MGFNKDKITIEFTQYTQIGILFIFPSNQQRIDEIFRVTMIDYPW